MVNSQHDAGTPAEDTERAEAQFEFSQYHSGLLRTGNSDTTVDQSVGSVQSRSSNTVRNGSPEQPDPAWPGKLLLTPLLGSVLTLAGFGLGLTIGFDVFAPKTQPIASVARGAVAIGYVAVSLLGTLWIYDDAQALTAASASWQPDPLFYIGGGAAGVGAAICWLFSGSLTATAQDIPAFMGIGILALCLASVLAGPAYLLRRRSELG